MAESNKTKQLILASRYTLLPMYFGLVVCMVFYNIAFVEDLWHAGKTFLQAGNLKDTLLIAVLGLVDMVMIGNLIIMITIGSYSIFIRELESDGMGNNPPRFLKNLTSGILKIKITSSLIAVSGVHLLADFINSQHVSWEELSKRLAILAAFLLSGIIFAKTETMLHPVESHREKSGIA